MLLASDHEPDRQRKKKKNAAEPEKASPQQHQCNHGHRVYRNRSGQHLMVSKPRSDFRHQYQVPEHDPRMR